MFKTVSFLDWLSPVLICRANICFLFFVACCLLLWIVICRSRVQWGPQVLIRTFALLEMAKYNAIQDHHNPSSQHGTASYVTKFESKSFKLRSNFLVAFAQRESCWRSQQSASKSRGKGKSNSGIFFGAGK